MLQGHSGEHRYLLQMLLLLMLVLFPNVVHGSSCGESLVVAENPKDGACGEMDIRNNVKNFRMLENCTVIEGSLHISLIDYVPQEEYDKYSFPLLREITGHFMMFRVFGLRSLRNIFPNLTVIRGQTKFFNDYALVAYEMRDLEELGLVGLTLVNGSVRLTRNNKLCHISSIDWGRLTLNIDPARHLFLDNREEQLCPDYCNDSCPSTQYQGVTRKRCWTSKMDDCQRNLVCQCPQGCAPNGSCCSEHCIGGCSGPTAADCYVCSKVVYQDACQSHCPHMTYMLSNRRCLTKGQCLSLLSRPTNVNRTDSTDNFPKLLEGDAVTLSQCVFKCPPGYVSSRKGGPNNPRCERCPGLCPKVCNTTIVSSIQDSEKLFGCSKIDGSLEIHITGGNDVDFELTKNLGLIREVTGYVKVWKSYPLLTLHFFQDLEVIGGEKLMHKGYSLFVADNTNLQEIFPEKQMRKMVIRKGRIGFHGNRKLCFSKISNLTKLINKTSYVNESRVDISNTSNGNLIPCTNVNPNLEITIMRQVVTLTWQNIYLTGDNKQHGDKRQLINYIINYKEVKDTVRDIFQGRDACSDNDWKTTDVEPLDEPTATLYSLKPFTKYAIYVQASTLPSASDSSISRIMYFQTSSSKPTEPTDLVVSSADPHELTLKWNPPKSPNGNVTHYKVFYQMQSFSTNGFEQRDFCKDPLVPAKDVQSEKPKVLAEEEEKKPIEAETDPDPGLLCCNCPISEEEILKQLRMRELEITFENDLHDASYNKKWRSECGSVLNSDHLQAGQRAELQKRLRRATGNSSKYGADLNSPQTSRGPSGTIDVNQNSTMVTIDDKAGNMTTTEPFASIKQEVIVYDTTAVLANLEHYHSYKIEVVACQETDPVTGVKLCGSSAIITEKTAPGLIADSVNSSLVVVEPVVNKSGEILVKWEPPLLPNGLILKYYLRYTKVELGRSSIPVTVCVSAKQFHNQSNGYLLQGLLSGNYSLQISAHSLAGNGTYTQEVFFYVPPKHGVEETDSLSLIMGICSGLAVLIILVGVAVFCYHKYRYGDKDVIVSQNPFYIPADQLYVPDEWEVPRDSIRLIKELGQGSFGTVFEGLMEDPENKTSLAVAVKTVNNKAGFSERLKILKEGSTMKTFEGHHIVKLLGIVSKGQPALVIMELMLLGDLRNYLRKCRLDEENYPDMFPPTNEQIHQMAAEIADGMAYLADGKIIHRDLAARNCLVAQDGTVKIADFGMARDVYSTDYYRKDQKAPLPVRWMAPESLELGIFTSMSDVWSYGIVLWEMVTLAEQPYQGLSNEEVVQAVIKKRVLNPPSACPEDLCSIMQRCWKYYPEHRPTFKSIIMLLLPYVNDQFRQVSYYFNGVIKRKSPTNKVKESVKEVQTINAINEETQKSEADKNFYQDSLVETSPVSEKEDVEGKQADNTETAHIDQSFASLSHTGSSHTEQIERTPLIQRDTEEPFLYPASVSAANETQPMGFSSEDDDIDSDNDCRRKDDKNYIRPSKDAKSSSERLKLLSDSPASCKIKLETLPAKSSSFTNRSGGKADEYLLVSPSSVDSSQVDKEHSLLASPVVSSHPVTSSATLSNAPLFALENRLPSSSPVLHVDMEGIGKFHKKQPTAVDLIGHGGESAWFLQNNKCNARKGDVKLSDSSSSNSNSNSSSIQSGSEDSKESSSSSGSHSRFHSATANGHGPFTHQQAALC